MSLNLTFGSGTSRQKTQWRQALDRLLSLPMSAVPLSVEVNFVDPSEVVTGHATDLAVTTWSYGSTSAATKVRNDAPGYGSQRESLEALAAKAGLAYNADLHFNETAVHEFGHALYAALPEERRIAIAAMFGAKSDSLFELQPIGVAWEDQIIEGIAETFKEAFLPRSLRVFPNRTNRLIPYERFPEFRRLFREAMPETGSDEEFEFDIAIFEQGGFFSGAWTDPRKGLYSGIDPSGAVKFQANASWLPEAGVVEGGHHFAYSWTIPPSIFKISGAAQTQLRIKYRAAKGHSSSTEIYARWEIVIVYTTETDTYSISIEENGGPIINPPSIAGATLVSHGTWIEVTGTMPPLTFVSEFMSDWKEEERLPMEITAEVDYFAFSVEEIESAAFINEFVEPFRATIPDFRFRQGGTPGGKGESIEAPPSSVEATGQASGRHPTKRPTAGSLH